MNKMTRLSLLCTTCLMASPVYAQGDCTLRDGALPVGCEQPNRDVVVAMPAGNNNELGQGDIAVGDSGFLISIDGDPVIGDRRVEDLVRKTDIALSNADVQIKFDGLGAKTRLSLKPNFKKAPKKGGTATFTSEMNYPSYVERGELRVIDYSGRTGPKTVQIVPIQPNGIASIKVPLKGDIVVVHRVYDARGRYDETEPLALSQRNDLGETELAEEGIDRTAYSRIPVSGGAVTVYGTGVRQGATVQTLGERVKPAPDGSFVLQRILPAGDQDIQVRVNGAGENVYLQRSVAIPRSEWFTVGLADLTFGYRADGGKNAAGGAFDKTYQRGRFAFYSKGKTQSGWNITASADTGEEELENLFRQFDEKDPRHLLLRLDSDKAYPVYGDDSTLDEDAPTSGKFYLKAEKDGNFALWGNYKSRISGTQYLRNERTLYGFQGHYASQQQTAKGDAVVEVDVYAAQPDNLPGRDVFRGTGGSVYFLQRQDLSIGSETIRVETRDATTGRVINQETLVYGRDYDINYLQGIITLNRPLTGATGGGTVISNPTGSDTVQLTVNYEYTPTAGDIDGYAYGGRLQYWASDNLRFGLTGMVEQTDAANQTALGADILYELTESSFVELEYAKTNGPGFGSSFSSDGGLVVTNNLATGGNGSAVSLSGQAEFADLGWSTAGRFSAYIEDRNAGFSTLDHSTKTDENLWGFAVEVEPNERLSYRVYYDDFKDKAGKKNRDGGVEATYKYSDRYTVDLGLEHVEKETPAGKPEDTGSRTDLAAKLTITENKRLKWYVFGQATLSSSGGLLDNNRVGAGVAYRFADKWTFEGEVSDGSRGVGALALLSYANDKNSSAYFGYTLDPGREFSGVTLSGRDRGQFVAGGRRKFSDAVETYAENTYDLFGVHRSLTSVYGVDYKPTQFLTYSASVELGRIDDPLGDFDRTALSLGVRYKNETGLAAKARLEFRRDAGVLSGSARDGDTVAFTSTARYQIDEESRLLFSFEGSHTDTDGSSIPDGEFAELSLGYAYRPIDNDKLNLLFKYTYLHNLYGQQVDGFNEPGPRQKSHVLSLDASYDVDRHWTVGGKIGGRFSDSSPNGTAAFAKNDAWLLVANARYHVTHKWDLLMEGRYLKAQQAGVSEYGLLGAAYRHVGNNFKVGVGYNLGKFSDDLTDLTFDDRGMFINLIAKY